MTLKGWAVAAGLVLLAPCALQAATEANFGAATTGDLVELCTAAPDGAIGTAAVNFCEGFAQGAVLVEMQNQVCVPWTKAFLHAESSALSQPGAERFRQLGTRVAGSLVGLIYRRVVQIPERTLSLYAITLINRSGERYEEIIAARGRRSASRRLCRYDPNSATGADRHGHRRRRRRGDWRDRRERRSRRRCRGGRGVARRASR